MHKQTHKRAFYTLAGCIAALALCVAASLFLLTPTPKAQDVTIPGTRGDIYATARQSESGRADTHVRQLGYHNCSISL